MTAQHAGKLYRTGIESNTSSWSQRLSDPNWRRCPDIPPTK